MTPTSSEQPQPSESEANKAGSANTSHDDPVLLPIADDEEVANTAGDAANDEQQQAAKRERADFLAGIRKLIKSFKNIFEIYKEEDEDNDEDIEIGFPTDVQHVAHIGLDGSANVRGLEGASRELLSLSNLTTLEQFEMAMASLPKERNGMLALDRVSRNSN